MKKVLSCFTVAAVVFAMVSCTGDGRGGKKAKFHYLSETGEGDARIVELVTDIYEIRSGKLMDGEASATAPVLEDGDEFVLTGDLSVNKVSRAKDDKLIVDGTDWYRDESCVSKWSFADDEWQEGDYWAKYRFDDGKIRVTFKMAKTDGTWINVVEPVVVDEDKKVPADKIPAPTALAGPGVITSTGAFQLTADLKTGSGDDALTFGLNGDKMRAFDMADMGGASGIFWVDAGGNPVDFATKTFDANATVYVGYNRLTRYVTFVYMTAKGNEKTEFEVKSRMKIVDPGTTIAEAPDWIAEEVKGVDLSNYADVDKRGNYSPSSEMYAIGVDEEDAPASLEDFIGVSTDEEFKFGDDATGTKVEGDMVVSWLYTKDSV